MEQYHFLLLMVSCNIDNKGETEMKKKLSKQPFPGHKSGSIRVLVKRGQREESVQLELNLFNDEDKSSN